MQLRDAVPLTLADILAKIRFAEEHYQGLEKLVLKKPDGELVKLKRDNTSSDFVRKFFDKFSIEYNTYIANSDNLFCVRDVRRSIGDVYRLSYSYYGDKMTMVALICHTYTRVLESRLTENYCYNINKRVYKNRPNKNGNYFDPRQPDELGMMKEHYDILLQHFKTHNHI